MTDSFASFVTDPANAAAATAARTVADASRALYGPLVLVGARGSGKSHLLRAVHDRATSAAGAPQVELLSLVRLGEMVHSRGLGEGATALRDRLVAATLVLLDDFEAVTRHAQTQALVFDVLESRLAAGREVVVASELPVDRLAGLDARLRRRLEAGTIVTLALPGADARRAILERRIAESGVRLPSTIAEELARQSFRSVKEYLGALNRVLAFQQTSPAPISLTDALALVGLESCESGGNGQHPAPAPPAPPAASAEPAPASAEFDAFLSDVVANVAQQFDHWRGRLSEAIAHWQGRGMRTRRLERARGGDLSGDPEPLIAEFGRDATELERLAGEARLLAPDLAGAEVLRDPDQLSAARALVEEARGRRAPLSAPLAELRLDTLGIGAANRAALDATAAVVLEPGTRYNPLVLVGSSGVGKTHLLHGLGNALATGGLAPIACLSAHSFLAEVAALRAPEEAAAWRTRYQWVAAFLLDDLHLLAREPRAQDELLQIFTGLHTGGRQLAFTTARPLSDLEGFDPRLLSRLEGGLVLELAPPDREIRLAVVRRLLEGTPAAGDAGLLDYLAGRAADSVRAVQGSVQRVLSEAHAQRVTPSPALAREVLDAVEVGGPRGSRPVARPRPSGVRSPGMGGARMQEKMVLRWPSPVQRLATDLS